MEGYAVGVITLLAINCIAAMGVSLFTGFTGIFTLGHAGYMAIGAYTAAILTVEYGVHFIPAIIAGGILAMILAFLIGIPTLKLVGDYYAIVSLGLGEAIRLIIENWNDVTRGARGYPGIDGFTSMPLFPSLISGIVGYFTAAAMGAGHGVNIAVAVPELGPWALAASLLGFNTAHYRNLSLAISGFYCGVSGALIAGYMSFIQPIMFDMAKSTELVSIVVFGGLGSMSGCLLGTTILTLVTELFRPISQYRMLIYGLVLVLVMVLRPEGIMGTNELTPAYLKKLFSRKKTGTAEEGAR